jgi:N-acetylmuramoyl-L-alanine amidase
MFNRIIALLFLLPILLFAQRATPLEVASFASQQASLKPSAKTTGPLVVLDAGHGGSDQGAKVRSLQEKKITLQTALHAKKMLEDLGYRVLLTRKKDSFISLPKRVSIANQTKGVLFVSIHCNAAPNTLAQGLEIYYYKGGDPSRSTKSFTLADFSLQKIIQETGCACRGVKSGRFYVIRETTMPSILVEIGFLTNTEEWANGKGS